MFNGYFQAIFKSFYSQDLYRDVAKNGNGDIFLYLLLVVFLSWLPAAAQMQAHLKDQIPALIDDVIPQFPEVTIKDGKVSTPENRPYIIKNPTSDKIEGVIDTSGQYINLDHPTIDMLLTKTEFISRENTDTIKIHKLPPTLNLVISPEKIKAKVVTWSPWVWIIVFPFLIGGSFLMRMLVAAFNSIFGLFFAMVLDVTLPYASLYRIAVMAMTPVIFLRMLVDLLGITAPLGMQFFALALFYLFFGIYANKEVK